jgi:hypothetical protein
MTTKILMVGQISGVMMKHVGYSEHCHCCFHAEKDYQEQHQMKEPAADY